jgi:hypothetical protein
LGYLEAIVSDDNVPSFQCFGKFREHFLQAIVSCQTSGAFRSLDASLEFFGYYSLNTSTSHVEHTKSFIDSESLLLSKIRSTTSTSIREMTDSQFGLFNYDLSERNRELRSPVAVLAVETHSSLQTAALPVDRQSH